MSITLYAKLDMTPGAVPTVVHRSQYDSDFTLVFSLYTRTGDFVIASGTTARMRGTKTTGTGYSVPVTLDVSAKTVTVTGDQQMTAAAGSNIFEVVLYRGDLEICSSNFILQVERAAMDADTITDETVVPELEHLEEYTQQAAEQAARSASTYAESWAVGGTGTREGEDTNNAKYWSEQAKGAVSGVASFNGRTGAVVPAANDYTAAQIKRSGGTVESALASVESVNMNQNTRLTGLESTVAGHGPRITAAENSIASQGTRLTTAESNITTLQNNKVDMTTPLLNFDDTAVDPTTDDGALANALRALAILDDVIPSGGGMLYLKKALTEYGKKVRKLASNNPRFAMKYITITNLQIPDGTQSSPATVTIDLGKYGITDSIWSATVYIGSHLLPYIDTSTGAQRTWVSKISWRSVTITNTTSGWGNATLYLFVISNGTAV